jgi:hypothetical protein
MGGFWKISIGSTPLCDYDDAVKGQPISGGPHISEDSLALVLGAVDAKLYQNLGNTDLQRKFEIVREHDDNAHAVDWYLNGAAKLNGVADVLLTHNWNAVEASYKISGAKVLLEVDEPVGVATTTKLTINGGLAVAQA